jgi:hypothetical protein
MALEIVNRAERIRQRAVVEAKHGRYENYWKLVDLSREAHLIREAL